MHLIHKLIACTFSLFLFSTTWADSANQDLINDLSHYQRAQGHFSQQIYDDHHMPLLTSSGSFALARPLDATQTQGKFLWDTQSPQKQKLVADGKKIYFYDDALQQVTIKNQHSNLNQPSPAMLLSGDIQQISKHYIVHAKKTANKTTYQLTPKPTHNQDNFFSALNLTFTTVGTEHILSDIESIDSLGQTTAIHFTNLTPTAAEQLFHFNIPTTADVVHGD